MKNVSTITPAATAKLPQAARRSRPPRTDLLVLASGPGRVGVRPDDGTIDQDPLHRLELRVGRQPLEQPLRIRMAADQLEIVDHPETAGKKLAFVAAQAVFGF